MIQEKTLVVVLTMHRCGSSLTANLLHRLGMSLGPFDLGETNESNPYGHFEPQPFVLLNREFQLRQFGFEGDIPDSAETLQSYCQSQGRWPTDAEIPQEAIERGRAMLEQLMSSGTVCGFKDPRTVLVWPLWQRVLQGMSGFRVVLLSLIRPPHEIAMSIFRRSQGDRDYRAALDVTAVHFRRMKEITDSWPGPSAIVRFDPQDYAVQAQQAIEICGLEWSNEAFGQVYDASCRHFEAQCVDHPAQQAFEQLAGLTPGRLNEESLKHLARDGSKRETTLRQRWLTIAQERDAARQEAASLYYENQELRQRIEAVEVLEAQLARTTFERDLIRGSRLWRLRTKVVSALGPLVRAGQRKAA